MVWYMELADPVFYQIKKGNGFIFFPGSKQLAVQLLILENSYISKDPVAHRMKEKLNMKCGSAQKY
jgi:hypothetical protein